MRSLAAAAVLCALIPAIAPTAALAQHHGDMFGAAAIAVSPCSDTTTADPRPDLRKVSFPVTTRIQAAQDFFDQGLTLVYAFDHQEAMRAFRSAARADDKLAMAHWGIALAAGPNINVGMDGACLALAQAETARARALAEMGQVGGVERALIDALAVRYTGAPTFEADYAVAMGRVAGLHRNQPDVLSLYAESLMDLRPWGLYDRAARPAIGTEEAVEVLRRAIAARPSHIGANHYLIHAVESSLHPERALDSALLLTKAVPASGHLLHMPSHIFMRLGRYHEATESNVAAVAADEAMYKEACEKKSAKCAEFYYGHYLSHNLSFETEAASMEGRSKLAIDTARRTTEHALRFVADEPGLEHYLAVYLTSLVNFRRWEQILRETPPAAADPCREGCPEKGCHLLRAMTHWARGMALAATGKPADAERSYAAFVDERNKLFQVSWGNNPPDPVLRIAAAVLQARIAAAHGRTDSAITQLAVAVSLEDDLIYDEPPTWLYPARQAWGGALLAAGEFGKAAEVFKEDLAANRNPGNGRSLFGLAAALEGLGDKAGAARARTQYEAAWVHADFKLQQADLW